MVRDFTDYLRSSDSLTPQDSQSELPPGQSPATWINWTEDNIGKPAYNAGIVQPANVFVNAVNAVSDCTIGEDVLSKATPYEIAADSQLSSVVQGVSAGVAGLWLYASAGKLASLGLRGLSRGMALDGMLARIAANEATGLVAGAGIIDGLRDLNPGETKLGNIAAGMTAFGVFGLGNYATRNWTLAERAFIANPLIGSLGSEAQLRVSRSISGQEIDNEEIWRAQTTGMAVNTILPWMQEGLSRGVDSVNRLLGRAPSADRFVYLNSLAGKFPSLDAEVRTNPLALVDLRSDGNGSHVKIDNRLVTVDPKEIGSPSQLPRSAELWKARAIDLGHELAHLRIAREAEPDFQEAKRLLADNQPEAAQARFLETRRGQERDARNVGDRIAAEWDAFKAGKGPVEPLPEGNYDRPLDASYESRFHDEWQRFAQSGGAYRPEIELFTGYDCIGDVHGCDHELVELLELLGYKLHFSTGDGLKGYEKQFADSPGSTNNKSNKSKGSNESDQPASTHVLPVLESAEAPVDRHLVLVGDLVDRGPHSDRVLALSMRLVELGLATAIAGNHDDKLARYYQGDPTVNVSKSRQKTINAIAQHGEGFRAKVQDFLTRMPAHFEPEDQNLIVVHARWQEGLKDTQLDRNLEIYGTSHPNDRDESHQLNWEESYKDPRTLVRGHDVVDSPLFVPNENGGQIVRIDTGCVFGHRLQALRFPELHLLSVPAQAVYKKH